MMGQGDSEEFFDDLEDNQGPTLTKGTPVVHAARVGIVGESGADSPCEIALQYGDGTGSTVRLTDTKLIWPEIRTGIGRGTYLRDIENCPLCGLTVRSSKTAFRVNQLGWSVPVLRCDRCSLVYKSAVPNDALLTEIYSSGYVHFSADPADLDLGVFESRVRRMGHLKPGKGVHLDYGCGNGGFVQCARSLGWESYGCDPYLPERLPPNVDSANLFRVENGSDSRLLRETGKYDVVSMWAVAEHLTKVGETFETVSGVLADGGLFIVNWPSGDSLAATRNGSRWGMGLLLEHLSFGTVECAQWIGREFSLEIESIRIAGLPYPLGESNRSEFEAQGLREPPKLYPSLVARDEPEAGDGPPAANDPAGSSVLVNVVGAIGGRLRSRGGVSPLAGFARHMIHHLRLGDHLEIRYRKRIGGSS